MSISSSGSYSFGPAEDESAPVDLTLFYVETPRRDEDPPSVRGRAEILYGEGRINVKPNKPSVRRESLTKSIRYLKISNTLGEIAGRLTQESFEDRLNKKGDLVRLFSFGLVRRPVVLGLPHLESGSLQTAVGPLDRLHQFVRTDKRALLERLAPQKDSRADARKTITRLLDELMHATGRDLRADNAQWLGDVLIGERRKRLAWWKAIPSTEQKSASAFEVHVTPSLDEPLHVQARGVGVDGMCVCDRLLEWPVGDSAPRRVDLREEFHGVFLRAWLGGRLVQEEQAVRLLGFHSTVQSVAAEYSIDDRLTRKLEGAVRTGAANPALLARSRRGQRTGFRTEVASGESVHEPWRGLNHTAQANLDLLRPQAKPHARFAAGPAGRNEAVLHFAELISKSEEALLLDPWLDVVGAEALVQRVQGKVHFTVLTNLAIGHATEKQELTAFLRAVSVVGLPENLRVLCAPSPAAGKQVFHDRFLLLRSKAGWTGYLLSNSFSGLAVSFPLYSVESPFATTALLLDDAEALLHAPGVEQIWPPESSGSTNLEPTSKNHGEFPSWRVFLNGLVPRGHARERAWLRAAERRGFLRLTTEGMKWLMEPEARARALRWLLDDVSLPRLHRPSRDLRSRSRPDNRRVGRPFDMGRSVLILGELAARGLTLDATEVARRLRPGHAYVLASVVRDSFRDGPDPTILTPGSTFARIQMRQGLGLDRDPVESARAAISYWSSGVWDIGRPRSSWDRRFAYGVLAQLAPHIAVAVCEDLLDPELVLALVGNLGRTIHEVSDELSRALAHARSPLLRAFGVCTIANGPFEGPETQFAVRPRSPADAVVELARFGITQPDRALYLALWGVLGNGDDRAACDAFAIALVSEFGGLSESVIALIVDAIFRDEVGGWQFLMCLVEALVASDSAHVDGVLRAVLERFAQRFSSAEERALRFYGLSEVRITCVLARALADHARRHGRSVSDAVRSIVSVESLGANLVRITPFVHRRGASSADVALGWIALWEVVAAAWSRTNAALEPLAEKTLAFAGRYLGDRGLFDSHALREKLDLALRDLTVMSVFGDAEVVVFVDEWKGRNATDGEILDYEGRVFRRDDPLFGRLTALLIACNAGRWHASGDRDKHPFLFAADHFDAILYCLDKMKTEQLSMPVANAALKAPHVDKQWTQIVGENPILREIWDTDNVYARALFRFTDFAFHVLGKNLADGAKVVVVVDRQDWLGARAKRGTAVAPGVISLGAGVDRIRGELWCIQDKTLSGAQPLLPFLGLVDSELWARTQRLMSQPLPDGNTVHDRLAEWRERGQPAEEPVLTQADLDSLFKRHEKHPHLRRYWQKQVEWSLAKRVLMIRDRDESG